MQEYFTYILGAGACGVNKGNGEIPVPANKLKKVNTDETLDLIEAQDLY